MTFFGAPYDEELARFGITYCDDHADCDRLVVAPGLKGHASRLEETSIYGSRVQAVNYLKVGPDLVGFGFPLFSGLVVHYWNGNIPAHLPMHFVTDIMRIGANDPEGRQGYTNEEIKITIEVIMEAERLIAPMEPVPLAIIERIQEYVADTYQRNRVH